MKKKTRGYITIVGLWIITICIIEGVSINPRDATSAIPPKPPPYEYLSDIIHTKQPKLDPILVEEIAKSTYQQSQKFHLPPELIIALMEKESSLIPTSTSKANCIGLLQINPTAHPEKVEPFEVYQLYYVDTNIKIGCQILKEYYDSTQSISEALKKYLGADSKTYLTDILTSFTDQIILKNNS